PRFSKTARSDPRHGEAGRNRWQLTAGAIVGWRLAHDLSEGASEGTDAGEADVETNVSDISVGASEQVHRPLDPPPLQVSMGRLAESIAERPDEMRLRRV